ncbi:hypothetical protein EJB05_24214, partial [Eragrostis curvula]
MHVRLPFEISTIPRQACFRHGGDRRTPTMPTLTFHQCTKLFCRVMQSILAAGALAVMVTDADELTPRSPVFEPLCSAAALQLVWSLLGIFDVLLELHPIQFGRSLAALLNAVGDAMLMKVIWAATWAATTLSQDMMLSDDDLSRFEVVMAIARASLAGQLTLLIQYLVNN